MSEANKVNIYEWKGVNTTKAPLQLEDNELTKAQNAQPSPTADGSMEMRGGLAKVNAIALGGSVLGLTNVPIDLIATRTFFVGVDQDTTPAHQWVVSTDAFATTATATTPAACARPDDAVALVGAGTITNRGLFTERLFLYPGDYTRGTPQPIRAYDGTIDQRLFSVPLNAGAVQQFGLTDYATRSGQIPWMFLDGFNLYVVSLDYIRAGTGSYSRVLQFNLDTNTLTQIGQQASGWSGDIGDTGTGGDAGGSVMFTCCAIHQGLLYAGVGPVGTGHNCIDSGVWRIRPGVDTAWTNDFDNSGAGDADEERPLCMASYKGRLFVGMNDLNTAASHIRVRDFAGTYTSSTSMGSTSGSAWTDMKVFGENLYACSFDNNGGASQTRIHKYDDTTWSVVKTIDSGTATPRMGVGMVVHNGRLYVLAINTSRNAIVTHTADGTAWTDQTSNLNGSANIVSIFGVLAI